MARTDVEMSTLILQKLSLLVAGETADTSDQTTLLTVYTSRMEYLRDDEVVWYADNAVPDAVADPLAEYMLLYVSPIFIPDSGQRAEYAARSQLAYTQLKRHASKRSQGAPVQVDYF